MAQKKGCLGFLIPSAFLNAEEKTLPYRLRDHYMTQSEIAFLNALRDVVGTRYHVCPKANLRDFISVLRPNANQKYRDRIEGGQVDVLLCDPDTMKPLIGIQLEGGYQSARTNKSEDIGFLTRLFRSLGLALVQVPAKSQYSMQEVALAISGTRSGVAAASEQKEEGAQPTRIPLCKRCGLPMEWRVSRERSTAGQQFWVCPNYPRCPETVKP